jgi:hypothetical protein
MAGTGAFQPYAIRHPPFAIRHQPSSAMMDAVSLLWLALSVVDDEDFDPTPNSWNRLDALMSLAVKPSPT